MILQNDDIFKRCIEEHLIDPFLPGLVNSATYDVRFGNHVLCEGDMEPQEVVEYFELWPGRFILAETMEYFKLPLDITAEFALKSSAARCGIQHLMAGFCDPGWHGRLTMELKNNNSLRSVFLVPGQRIGQMKFTLLTKPTTNPYSINGRYHGDDLVQKAKTDIYLTKPQIKEY